MDDIIKLIRGQENISNIPKLMVDMCKTLEKLPGVDSPLPDDPKKPPQRHFMG
jgi:hypothetical protein